MHGHMNVKKKEPHDLHIIYKNVRSEMVKLAFRFAVRTTFCFQFTSSGWEKVYLSFKA